MPFQLRWLVMLAAVLAAGLVSRQAAAQLTPVQKQQMKLHYEKATRAYDVQKYTEAIDEYQKAYEIGGDPAMLFNIGQAHRLNDQLPEAVRFYRRYLQRSPNARNRDDVERKIADLERTVEERRKIAAATSPPAPDPTALAAAGAPSAAMNPPPPVVPSETPGTPPPAVDERRGRGKRVAGFVLLGVGALALATAAVTGKMASDKAADLTDASNRGAVFDPAIESDGKALNTTAIVSAVVGGAVAATGALLLVLSRGGGGPAGAGEPHALVAPVIGGGAYGAAAILRF